MKKTILLIDDEPALLAALVDKFSRAGFDIISAENGELGLESALENKPDLILLDIIMPVMDGITMLSKLRTDPWGKKAKVILLTNLSYPLKPPEGLTKGIRGYLVKSDWQIEDVVSKVSKELGV
ncbi:response regulator [Candidatus Dojkabacteria bacterium]|nr:response regulator [Candidatus Dojkabacteria bacterium]